MLRRESYLLTKKFLKCNSLLLILPIILFLLSWILSAAGSFVPDFLEGFNLLVLLIAPGYYIAVVLGKIMKLRLDEILVLDVMISAALAMFVSIYLSFSFLRITRMEIFGGLFVVTVLSGVLLLPQLLKPEKFEGKVSLSSLLKVVLGLLVSFLIGFLFIMRVIPESYWRGWDPWLNTPVARTILEEGLNPFELSDRYTGIANVGISGFYYFLAAFQAFTGIDFYLISRFGGPVLAGITSIVTYLLVRRLEGVGAGLMASFFLFLNPFFVTRFSMTLRENFGFVFFLGILFLLIIKKENVYRNWISRFCFSFVLGLFLAVSLSVHSLVPVIVYGVVLLVILLSFFKTKRIPVELVLALFLSFPLATSHLLPHVLTFIWVIHNWFSLSLESFFLFFIVIIVLVTFILHFYSTKKMFKFSEKLTKRVLFIVGACLFAGTVYSIVFPKNFPILGSYNPPITLDMFALSSLILAAFGFLTVFRSSVPLSIVSFSLILILIPNLTNVNVAFPLFRLVIYMCWVLSYGVAKFLRFIYDAHRNVKLKARMNFRLFKKKLEIGNCRASVMICIVLLTLLSPIILQDIQASTRKYYSNYTEEDVQSAIQFISLLEDSDLVVPQAWAHDLLIYAGIDLHKMISNKSLLQELYSVNNIQNFSLKILSSYPNTSRAHVFMIQRRIGNKNCPGPSLDLLEVWGEKHQLGSIVVYTISLPVILEEKELLEAPIQVQLPAGPQWVHINITGTNLSTAQILALRIINNNNASKTFFAKIQDTHGNATEQILFTLQPGDKSYYIHLTELKEAIDLSNPAKLTLCFSWYGWEPNIDLTITNMTLITLKN